mmetsp:Transcript_13985/g.41549  ORF Transcript_13985/g.41549 Transcript_13985/m.41549 type:complete len:318 (-) Transcript_13985:19-972(-)
MRLERYFVVVPPHDHGEAARLRHLLVIRQILVREGDDLANLGVLLAESFQGARVSVENRSHGLVRAAKCLFAVHRLVAAARAKAEKTHSADAWRAVLACQAPQGMRRQAGLEVWHVGIQPSPVELLNTVDQLVVGYVVPVVVSKAHIIDRHKVEHLDHAVPRVQGAQKGRGEEIARERGDDVAGRETFGFGRNERLKGWQVVQQVHIAYSDDPHAAKNRGSPSHGAPRQDVLNPGKCAIRRLDLQVLCPARRARLAQAFTFTPEARRTNVCRLAGVGDVAPGTAEANIPCMRRAHARCHLALRAAVGHIRMLRTGLP